MDARMSRWYYVLEGNLTIQVFKYFSLRFGHSLFQRFLRASGHIHKHTWILWYYYPSFVMTHCTNSLRLSFVQSSSSIFLCFFWSHSVLSRLRKPYSSFFHSILAIFSVIHNSLQVFLSYSTFISLSQHYFILFIILKQFSSLSSSAT